MIGVIAKLNVKDGSEAEFEDVFLTLSEAVRANEPGCLLYQLCKDDEGNYVVMEMYESEEALAAHGASEHFKAAGAGFKGKMGGPPEITRMGAVTR
ncbi:MAG: putative quinol monooxygenase [Pseudomonadota bacterium]